ncbi:MAG TPA: hypothetical protein VGM11_00835 [Acidobacteriaceae bacterium]|jgi:hypothetical protein
MIALTMLSSCAALLSGCFGTDRSVFHQLRHLAGPRGIDCGVVLYPGHEAKDNACAIGAASENAAFFVHYIVKSGDGTVDRGVALTPSGRMLVVSDDPNADGIPLPAQVGGKPIKAFACVENRLAPDPAIRNETVLTCQP